VRYIPDSDPLMLSAVDMVAMVAEVGDLHSRAPWRAWHKAAWDACSDIGLPHRLAGTIASRARQLWIARIHEAQQS